MKIHNDRTDHVDRAREQDEKTRADDGKDAKDFKKLLDGKRGGEKGEHAAKKMAGKTLAHGSHGEPGHKTLGEAGRGGEFGARTHDGRVQLGQQQAQDTRLHGELHTESEQHDKLVEHRHHQRHEHRVRGEHAQRSDARPELGQPAKTSRSGAEGVRGDDMRRKGVESAAAAASRAPVDAARAAGAQKADASAPADRAELRAKVAELADKLVEKAQVGTDAAGRQIMLLDVEVPGRGKVHIRLRKRGGGFELRMRPENEEFARDLRHEREHFRQSAAEHGVDFSSIDIV